MGREVDGGGEVEELGYSNDSDKRVFIPDGRTSPTLLLGRNAGFQTIQISEFSFHPSALCSIAPDKPSSTMSPTSPQSPTSCPHTIMGDAMLLDH